MALNSYLPHILYGTFHHIHFLISVKINTHQPKIDGCNPKENTSQRTLTQASAASDDHNATNCIAKSAVNDSSLACNTDSAETEGKPGH